MSTDREATPSSLNDSRLELALLCMAIGLGLFWLWPMFFQQPPLALDEHVSFWMLQDGFPEPFLQRTLNIAAVPPASGVLEKASLTVLGQSETALRLPSAMCYLAAIALMFDCCRSLGSSTSAGMASLLLACHPDVVDEVRIARPYGLVLLLSVAMLWITLHWIQSVGNWRTVLAWALCAAALMWTHYTSLPLMLCSSLVLGFNGYQRRKSARHEWLCMLLAGALGAGLCLPLLPSLLRLREWSPLMNFAPVGTPGWKSVGLWWWLTGALSAVGLIVSLFRRRETTTPDQKLWMVFAGLSLAPLVLLAFLGGGDALMASPRYRVALAPASVALWASVLWWPRQRLLSTVTLVTLCAACWTVAPRPPWRLGRLADPASHDWKQLAETLQLEAHDGEMVFVQSGLVEASLIYTMFRDDEFSSYVACRLSRFDLPRPMVRKGLPFLWSSVQLREYYQKLLREDSQGRPPTTCWIATAIDTDLNRQSGAGMVNLATREGYAVTQTREWPTVRLLHLERK